ncbi:hypothetical protein BU14_0397s0012 [Porphyra umbilicalis]|uniref:Phosphatidic acid phosphatase type 2/haloperoxidase domain-containing protein n=1 Tax=Porphyra umbilicalis TaxID=2786 RepID=A0A1X6NWB9_PORUM|nr:hypothetical protein BU14_0397s0012 [Porphyra umbilicalis]|eukprot:OSX72887.1 hypothetical protein BU14_0397s0012 [Porphyra umbilicalis]
MSVSPTAGGGDSSLDGTEIDVVLPTPLFPDAPAAVVASLRRDRRVADRPMQSRRLQGTATFRAMSSVAADMDTSARSIPAFEWVSVLLIGWVVPAAIHVFIRPYARPIDLTDASFTKPLLPDLVPSFPVLIASYAIPVSVVFLTEMVLFRRSRTHKPLMPLPELLLALFEANGLTVLVTDILKSAAGRPRPHFAAVCGSYLASPPAAPFTCAGAQLAVDEARRSFPSGHSSLSMSAGVFTACYLAAVLRRGGGGGGGGGSGGGRWRVWMGLVVAAPLLVAALVAVSRTVDYHHHWSDVVAGATLGGPSPRRCGGCGLGGGAWRGRRKPPHGGERRGRGGGQRGGRVGRRRVLGDCVVLLCAASPPSSSAPSSLPRAWARWGGVCCVGPPATREDGPDCDSRRAFDAASLPRNLGLHFSSAFFLFSIIGCGDRDILPARLLLRFELCSVIPKPPSPVKSGCAKRHGCLACTQQEETR